MLPLNDSRWNDLRPKSFAPSFPKLLHQLALDIAAGQYRSSSLGQLATMCDQWSTFDSTLAAVPHLVEICRNQEPSSAARMDLLSWIGWCASCCYLNQQDGADDLKDWFNESIAIARRLVSESIPHTESSSRDHSKVRNLLAAFAACNKNYGLAFLLYELDSGGFRCDHCRQFIRPMESSMNPLWGQSRDHC